MRPKRSLLEGAVFALSSISDEVLQMQGYKFRNRSESRFEGSLCFSLGISGGDLDFGTIVFSLVRQAPSFQPKWVTARVDLIDPDDPSSLDFSDISHESINSPAQDSIAPKRRVVLVYMEGTGTRSVSSELPASFSVNLADMEGCVHFLLQDKGDQRKHLALRCVLEAITSLTYVVHIELFSSPVFLSPMEVLARAYDRNEFEASILASDHGLLNIPPSPSNALTPARSPSPLREDGSDDDSGPSSAGPAVPARTPPDLGE
ncbi:hypothetical protein DICSQDRAFT_167600 [Dichomitus squalens LYAD-421 SS1]|uniref:uncharacterized protein n=1 Tax=Dichomitus squalens (strain LYAD-421) TaxID=732165 RepID=UPI0004412613|nr:uncharacterized protein DICSQDRAFT_167600 [Dichomitus squalens LYAD-421 SS1]EJF64443.1 hypothetical protein DICSQDRAFT_167600 [Dichomitus squalens LYAD-421 SS1]